MQNKVVFIDRDGVINDDPIGDYVKHWEDFKFLPGVLSALKKLVDARFRIVIISNQAGVGDGVYSEPALQDITQNMLTEMKKAGISIQGVYYCLHGKEANCNCRKPKTGLFEQAARDLKFEPSNTYFIGDKLTDVQAGKRFGLRTVFVLTGHGANDRNRLSSEDQPEAIFPSLSEAISYIIEMGSGNYSPLPLF